MCARGGETPKKKKGLKPAENPTRYVQNGTGQNQELEQSQGVNPTVESAISTAESQVNMSARVERPDRRGEKSGGVLAGFESL